ncbi:MAG: asparaginase [Clostridia bacterium]|nr:asparaginase [Clostridia bacterium]
MKKILMLTTGGTIASVPSEEGLRPLGSEEILAHIGGAYAGCELTAREILTLDSSNIQPEEWKLIAAEIYAGFDGYDGIVVTHGTDTMAYTASMTSFMLQNPPVPVVFTGSQLPISHPLTDAVSNLRSAFAMACSGAAGVFIAFDRKIMLGCRGVKVRTVGFDAFESVNLPPVGVISSRGLELRHSLIPAPHGSPTLDTDIDTRVFLLKLTPGTDPEIIDLLIERGYHGIVIEAFGSGGMQFVRRDFTEKLGRAADAGVPVVLCSQCLYEASDPTIYQVGMRALEKGVIQGLDVTSEAAVTKLMWILARASDPAEVRRMFTTPIAGEINPQ